MKGKSEQVTRVQELETMAVFALILLLLGIRFQRQIFCYLAIAFLLCALFVRPLARIITIGWSRFSLAVGHVNNRIILTLIFYLLLTPLALVYRLFNKDPLGLLPKAGGSYYSDRNHTYVSADLEKMW